MASTRPLHAKACNDEVLQFFTWNLFEGIRVESAAPSTLNLLMRRYQNITILFISNPHLSQNSMRRVADPCSAFEP